MAVRGRNRQRSIWSYSGLFLVALLISAIWIGLIILFYEPGAPRSRFDFTPPPPNAVSTHILDAKSGQIELVRLVAEKDWETACIVGEEDDPLFTLQRHFNMKVATTTRPPIDEEWKDHLWKIAIVKGDTASVYYLDNRRIGRLARPSCMPLDRAVLIFQPDEDRLVATIADRDVSP